MPYADYIDKLDYHKCYYEKHREEMLESMRQMRINNRNNINYIKARKEYRDKNSTLLLQAKKEYYYSYLKSDPDLQKKRYLRALELYGKDKLNRKSLKHYYDNREKICSRNRKRLQELLKNPEFRIKYYEKRRAQRRRRMEDPKYRHRINKLHRNWILRTKIFNMFKKGKRNAK